MVSGRVIALAAFISAGVISGATGCEEGGSQSGDRGFRGAMVFPKGTIRGAGATFPSPIYSQWSRRYFEETAIRLEYKLIGSEAGIGAITRGEVDFGTSEIPLTTVELDAAGLVQFPMVIGGVVPVYNLSGIASGQLELSADVLAEIYLGSITRWNHEKIATLNPGVVLPNREIIPIHTRDTSGTTWIFSSYLERHSPRWRASHGVQRRIEWPVGVLATNNPQVARFAKQFKHTLSYIELSQAVKNGLTWAKVSNHTGAFVVPNDESLRESFQYMRGEGTPDLRIDFTEGSSPRSWPITGTSYVLLKRQPQNMMRLKRTLEFLHWALYDCRDVFEDLEYITIPMEFLPTIEQLWTDFILSDGQPVWEAEYHRFRSLDTHKRIEGRREERHDIADGGSPDAASMEADHATPLLGNESN